MDEPSQDDEEIARLMRSRANRAWRKTPLAGIIGGSVTIALLAWASRFNDFSGPQVALILAGFAAAMLALAVVISNWGEKPLPPGALKRAGVRVRLIEEGEKFRKIGLRVQIGLLTFLATATCFLAGSTAWGAAAEGIAAGSLFCAMFWGATFATGAARSPLGGQDELRSVWLKRSLQFGYPLAVAALIALGAAHVWAPGITWWAAPLAIWLAVTPAMILFAWQEWRAEQDA